MTSMANIYDEGNGEIRVVSETGGAKGQKLAQLGSLDPVALLHLAEVSGFGAQKYEAFNFLRGYDWRLSFDAMQRHSLAFWSGQDRDEESGLLHTAHAAWHGLAMTSFILRNVGTDTRPPEMLEIKGPLEQIREKYTEF